MRELYLSLRGGTPARTRINIEKVVALLVEHGLGPVLETNVWTLPTPDIAALRRADRALVERSTRPIVAVTELLDPVALIVHGAEATKGLASVLGRALEPARPDDPVRWFEGRPTIITIPSLSPPPANAWLPRSGDDLHRMAARLRRLAED